MPAESRAHAGEPAVLPPPASAVLDFWFDDALALGWPSQSRSALWFGGGALLDQDISQRFGHLVQEATAGGLASWEESLMVLLLDQFTRNVFRGQARAFSGDARAQSLALNAMAWDAPGLLPLAARVFMCMPLMHAEDITLQNECVRRLHEMHQGASRDHKTALKGHLDAAAEHREIVARYDRFPHRNAVLGRPNTSAEEQFLRGGKRFGQ